MIHRQPMLSVVTEASTREITEIFSLEKSIRFFHAELKRAFPDGRFELIVAANYPPAFSFPSKNFKWVVVPRVGYYGLKNAGFKAARGGFVAFWDSDCRPGPGYATNAVRRLEANPSLGGVAGASFYMGSSYWARLEALLTYGHLHAGERSLMDQAPMSHNLVLRKSRFKKPPFGPFTARLGGDVYATRYASKLGYPFWVDPKLNMYHERQDLTSVPAKFIEKRMMRLCSPLTHWPARSAGKVLFLATRAAAIGFLKRAEKVLIYRKYMSFNWWETLLSLPALVILLGIDGLLIAAMAVWPPCLKKTLRHQCGIKWMEIHRYMKQVAP